jgi:DNA-binding transcriptional LysR family regulator
MLFFVAAMATIDLNQVGAFVRVVDAGSFTAAAAALGLPKSSVSRGVARLEDALGVRLLQRTTRKLTLTEAGQRYFQQARASLAGLDEAGAAVIDMGHEPQGLVRITIPIETGQGRISGIIARFLALHPRITVDVTATSRRVDLVREGIDIAVRGGPMEDSSLVARRIVSSDLGIFASPAYLARRGRPRRLADLDQHDGVQLRSARGLLPWRFVGPRGPEAAAPTIRVTVDDLGLCMRLVLAGVGLGMLPTVGFADELGSGALVRVLPAYGVRGGALYVVTPPLRHMPTRVALLRDFLIAELTSAFAHLRR